LQCESCGAEIPEDAVACPACGRLSEHTLITQKRRVLMLGERYSIIALLGRGGFGAVYLARDMQLGETVAVKTLPPEVASDPASVEQLKKEVLLARQLHHENIAAVYNFEVDRTRDVAFIVMEYVDGADLSRVLREAGGKLGVRETLLIGRQVAAAIDYAHSKRLIHRDIKPKNILVRRDGVVKVTDFGVARRLRETMTRISQSVIAGTPAYMAPEHLMGEAIDVRADIYSLAATIYECLCGHPPFWQGAIEAQVLSRQPEPIPYEELGPQISPEGAEALNAALLKGLAKTPEERPESAEQFLKALEEAVGGGEQDRSALTEPVVAALKERAKFMKAVKEEGMSAALDVAELQEEAETALREGEFAKAVWFLQRLQRVSPSERTEERIRDIKRMQDRYHSLRQKAKEAEERGDLEEALRLMEEAAEVRPASEVKEEVGRLKRRIEAEGLRGQAATFLAERDWEKLAECARRIEELGFDDMAAPIKECVEEGRQFEEFREKAQKALEEMDAKEGMGKDKITAELSEARPQGLKRLEEDVAHQIGMVKQVADLWDAVKTWEKARKEWDVKGITEALEKVRGAGLDLDDYTRALRRGEAATLYPHIGGNLTKALLEMRRSRIFLERIADAEDYYARGWLSLAARRYETIPDEFLTPQQKERRDSVLRWERARRKRNLFYFAFVIWCVVLFIILVALLS